MEDLSGEHTYGVFSASVKNPQRRWRLSRHITLQGKTCGADFLRCAKKYACAKIVLRHTSNFTLTDLVRCGQFERPTHPFLE